VIIIGTGQAGPFYYAAASLDDGDGDAAATAHLAKACASDAYMQTAIRADVPVKTANGVILDFVVDPVRIGLAAGGGSQERTRL
jgi:hypothetical protein